MRADADAGLRVILPARIDPAAFGRLRPGAGVHVLAGRTMGTGWTVKVAGPASPGDLAASIQAVLDEVVAEMSGWEPSSALSRFNRAAPGSWHALSPGFFHVLAAACQLAEVSGGAFDPTIGALVDLWGFGPVPAAVLPPPAAAVAEARERSGWRRLALDRPARRACQPGGLALDLSGIAKGYAVDRVAALLAARGLRDALVEVGGELKGTGLRPDGQPWWVAIEPPPGVPVTTRLALHGLAVASSGGYRRFFDHAGPRYAHTLDPRTGVPLANGLAAVTVLHAECMHADALATALAVLGLAKGLALATALDVAALFVAHDGGETPSPALSRLCAPDPAAPGEAAPTSRDR